MSREPRDRHNREVVRYGMRATVVKVSAKANYAKIFVGERDNVQVGDAFYIFNSDLERAENRRLIAYATVARLQKGEAAYLHVEELYSEQSPVQEGFEARQVFFEGDE